MKHLQTHTKRTQQNNPFEPNETTKYPSQTFKNKRKSGCIHTIVCKVNTFFWMYGNLFSEGIICIYIKDLKTYEKIKT